MGVSITAEFPDGTTHDAMSISYSTFGHLRNAIASTVGLDLMQMEGYKAWGKRWGRHYTGPLLPLFQHSDAEGDWTTAECAQMEPALWAAWNTLFDAFPAGRGAGRAGGRRRAGGPVWSSAGGAAA